jgi:hypothetical protein
MTWSHELQPRQTTRRVPCSRWRPGQVQLQPHVTTCLVTTRKKTKKKTKKKRRKQRDTAAGRRFASDARLEATRRWCRSNRPCSPTAANGPGPCSWAAVVSESSGAKGKSPPANQRRPAPASGLLAGAALRVLQQRKLLRAALSLHLVFLLSPLLRDAVRCWPRYPCFVLVAALIAPSPCFCFVCAGAFARVDFFYYSQPPAHSPTRRITLPPAVRRPVAARRVLV